MEFENKSTRHSDSIQTRSTLARRQNKKSTQVSFARNEATPQPSASKNVGDEGKYEDIANVLLKFVQGIRPEDNDLIFAAQALRVDTRDLIRLRSCLFE